MLEVFVAQHLYMIKKANYEARNAFIIGNVGLEKPMGIVIGTKREYGMRIFLLHAIVRRHVQTQEDMMAYLAPLYMNMSVKAFLCLLTFSHSLSRISTMLILEILNVLFLPDSTS